MDTGEEFVEGDFKRNGGIEYQPMFRQPVIEKNRLGQAAGKTIEHPATGLSGKPIREDRAHQVVRKIFTAVENRLRLLAERRPVFHLLAEQCAGAEITETETFREPPPLSALTGGRRPDQDNSERSGSGIDQWTRL